MGPLQVLLLLDQSVPKSNGNEEVLHTPQMTFTKDVKKTTACILNNMKPIRRVAKNFSTRKNAMTKRHVTYILLTFIPLFNKA